MIKNKVGIIGGGIGGIAAALRLVAKGYEVHLFEKNEKPGGKISEFHQEGFRFDMGPSLFTMPEWVDELFLLFDKDPREHFRYRKLENSCTYFYHDDSVIKAYSDTEELKNEFYQKAGIDPERLESYLTKAERLYTRTEDVFIKSSLHRLKNYFSKPFFRAYPYLINLDAPTTLHKRNKKTFDDPRIVQLFDRFATYVGSNPYKTPATLKIITHLEHNIGAHFPENGMYEIISALWQLGKDTGVHFHFNASVDKILTGNAVKGLRVNNENIPFDHVISNADVYYSNSKLLGEHFGPKPSKLSRFSTSGLIFYWGIDKSYSQLGLHNILFSKDYEDEFNAITNRNEVYHDPTIYLFITSKQVTSDAPEGKENWYVMINVPPYDKPHSSAFIDKARRTIIKKINSYLNTKIEEHILFEKYLSPHLIEERTSSYRGSLYGINADKLFNAFLRYPNFSRKIKNLYFVGGSVHPGGGIPMCLSSARIVSDEFKSL